MVKAAGETPGQCNRYLKLEWLRYGARPATTQVLQDRPYTGVSGIKSSLLQCGWLKSGLKWIDTHAFATVDSSQSPARAPQRECAQPHIRPASQAVCCDCDGLPTRGNWILRSYFVGAESARLLHSSSRGPWRSASDRGSRALYVQNGADEKELIGITIQT